MTMIKTARQGFDKDCYETPQWLFDLLDKEFDFIIDACTNDYNENLQDNPFARSLKIKCNSKCMYYLHDALKEWKPQVDHLSEEYKYFLGKDESEYSVFMNPPYSNPGPFLERAWEFSKYMRVVCLVRDDSSTRWYQALVGQTRTGTAYPESFNDIYNSIDTEDISNSLNIIRLPKRLKFEINGEPQGTYNFPCCLMIMDRRGCN